MIPNPMFPALTPRRRRILIWMILGVLALVLLAGGLSTFTLQPGRVFQQPTYEAPDLTAPDGAIAPTSDTFNTLLRGILAVLLVILPLTIILAMFSKQGRKRLLTNAVMIAMLLFVLSRVQEVQQQAREAPPAEQGLSNQIPGTIGEPLPPPPNPPSDEFVLIASLAIVVIGLVLAFWLGRRWLFPRQSSALTQIAEEADRARDALASGGALEDVVIRSYRQMNKIVAEARELRRPLSATPREFEDTLAGAGLPMGPLDDLTKLFEQVRYGGLVPGPAERKIAIDSLTAIAAACREEQRKTPARGSRVDLRRDPGYGGMRAYFTRRRLLIMLASVMVTALLALILRDFVRSYVVLPLLNLGWIAWIFMLSVPQTVYWGMLLLLVIFIAVRSLSSGATRDHTRFERSFQRYNAPSRYGYWQAGLKSIARSSYAHERIERDLQILVMQILAEQRRVAVEELRSQIFQDKLDLTGEVQPDPGPVQTLPTYHLYPRAARPAGLVGAFVGPL